MKSARPQSWIWAGAEFFTGLSGCLACALVMLAALAPRPVYGQTFNGENHLAISFTGQFMVTGTSVKSPLARQTFVVTNASLLRLDPALLSVSAERIKQSLYHLLGISSVRDWQGKIYLALRPALRTDETVTVVARPMNRSWSYQVQLPDVVLADRYLQGITGALLLELANRQTGPQGHCADVPAWLIDGLSRQLLQDELAQVLLTAPTGSLDRPLANRPRTRERELDPLAGARKILRNHSPLTYDQLSWPTEAQLTGADSGVYHASAQLFVEDLLKLNDGPARLRRMLEILPQGYNWQTAFQTAFKKDFARPLEVEKWWALQVEGFLSHDLGPAWTPAFSADRLNELLQVPVAMRASSNSLPREAKIPLQAVVHDFKPQQQTAVLETHLRDLRVAQLRMASQFGALTEEYCRVLAGYLGERLGTEPRPASVHHPVSEPVRMSSGEFVKRLDALDGRRRILEAAVKARGGAV